MFPQTEHKPTHLIEVDTGAKIMYLHATVPGATQPHVEHVYAPFQVLAEQDPTERWMFPHPENGKPCCVAASVVRPLMTWHQIIVKEGARVWNLQANGPLRVAHTTGVLGAFSPCRTAEMQPQKGRTYYFSIGGVPCMGHTHDFLPGYEIEEYDEAKHAQD